MNLPLKSLAAILVAMIAIHDPSPSTAAESSREPLKLKLRSRAKGDPAVARTTEKTVQWAPQKTAIIICDMWDDHWCKSASRRVGEMAGPLNEVIRQARSDE